MVLLRCAVFGVLAWLGVHLIVKSPRGGARGQMRAEVST